jgi:hypothetical protein
MTRIRFPVIDFPMALATEENPPSDRSARTGFAHENTLLEFLIDVGFLKEDSAARFVPREEAIVWTDELTDEGYDFIMAKQRVNWLGACDRKATDIGRKGGTFEEQLKVYEDSSGLYRRLEKFRKARAAKAH